MNEARRALILLIALVVMACGESDGPAENSAAGSNPAASADEELGSTAPTTAQTTTTERATTTTEEPVSTTVPERRLVEFEVFVQETVELPRMDYVSESTSTVNGGELDTVVIRTGWFDDDSWNGEGTMSFASSEPSAPELDEPFAFRLLDDEYWTSNPLDNPPTWTGWDLNEFIFALGGDPSAAMDGDQQLLVLLEAAVDVVEVEVIEDNTERWELTVRADDLLTVFSLGGAAQRLAEAGAADTAILETAVVTVQDGLVIEAVADLSTWWTRAQAILLEQGGFDRLERPDQDLGSTHHGSGVLVPVACRSVVRRMTVLGWLAAS